MTSPKAIECENLVRRYGSREAVAGISLGVPAGSLMALVGPSGCGKTTLLRLIAGFERPDGGRILLGGREFAAPRTWIGPEHRHVGMVFQDYALFPHLNVVQNIAYGLRRRERTRERLARLIALVGLERLERRLPHQLSGGEQQRVALARALAPEPSVVLMDEPFANLDNTLRASVREQTRAILRRCGATAVLVTHDQEEALSMADTMGVMLDGRIVQIGAPAEVYRRPNSREVARLLGDGNLLPGLAENGCVLCALGRLRCAGAAPRDGPCEVFVRSESIRLSCRLQGECPGAVVEETVFYGHDQAAMVRTRGGCLVRVRLGPTEQVAAGNEVGLSVDDPVVVYPAGLPVD